MPRLRALGLLASCVLAAAGLGCGGDPDPGRAAPPAGSSRFALATDPSPKDALSVRDARASAPKATAVVLGRVREVASGFAAFTMIDASLKFCGEGGGEETCPHPWDYCCYPEEEIVANLLPVAVKSRGEVVMIASMPELRNLDLVAVVGNLVKDAQGDVSLEATGWYRRERPALPSGLEFPK